ncbi:MAG: helix-turn-helix domain-containing protein, partial [Candidatus Berkelbacteria bacterium]|nr:helix-turn-helix domain-containing protein [Candidatus Berkelbacteria bacterium]
FQVNPEVLEVDDKFRIESENAEKMFRDFPENEIKKKYDNFILYAGGEIKAVDVFDRKKKQKSSTYDETLALWKEGKNLFQISEIRGLVENTILGHLEKLVDEKRIERPELLKIVPENFLPDLAEIMLAFKKFGTDSLSPTFHHFSGKYSYDELRMARIVLG